MDIVFAILSIILNPNLTVIIVDFTPIQNTTFSQIINMDSASFFFFLERFPEGKDAFSSRVKLG